MMVRAMIARLLVVVSLALLATLSLAVVALSQPANAAGTRAAVRSMSAACAASSGPGW